MHRILIALTSLLSLGAIAGCGGGGLQGDLAPVTFSGDPWPSLDLYPFVTVNGQDYAARRILVYMKERNSERAARREVIAIINKYGMSRIAYLWEDWRRQPPVTGFYLLLLPDDRDLFVLKDALMHEPTVLFAKPDGVGSGGGG